MKSLKEQFTDWVRTKPADEEYEFESIGRCALCQFLKEAGYAEYPLVDYKYWIDDAGQTHPLTAPLTGAHPGSLFAEELGVSVIGARPWTFGALASRLSA